MSDESLYNEKEKLEYLETIKNDEVKDLFYFLFTKSRGAEELYQKDLYMFSLDQIDIVMKNINPTTLNSVANNKSRINRYIRWAIKNGRRTNNTNPLQPTGVEWANKFIDKTTKRHLSSVEIDKLTEKLQNAQDQALVQCIFEGVLGKGLSELLSMNISNINWQKNEIAVRDDKDGKYRTLKMSDKCMRFIENAYNEESYISEEFNTEKKLMDHKGYIFKNTKWRSTKNQYVSRGNLAKRIGSIKRAFELDEFSAITISESGRIKMAADILKTEDTLTKVEFAKIGDRFNLPKTINNDYEYYNVSVMKNYINEENLKKLYGIDIKL